MANNRPCICQISAVVVFFIGAALLTAGLVINFGVFPNKLETRINKQKVLGLNDDGTYNSFTNSWINSNYVSTMEYWVFNYTNTIGIMNRAIYPDMIEKGPYAYDEIISMDRINFTSDGEYMHFRKVSKFVFNKNKSCNSCDPYKDKVLIPDLAFQLGIESLDKAIEKLLGSSVAQKLCKMLLTSRGVKNPEKTCKELASLIEGELGTLMTLFDVSPFIFVTVDELLFSGYKSPFISKFINEALLMLYSFFGTPPHLIENPKILLNNKNGTSNTIYTVLTGKTDPSMAGYIVSFTNITNSSLPSNGDKLPSAWWPHANETYCKNSNYSLTLAGTNADFFKNFIERTETIPVFIENICRTVEMVYDRDIIERGISGYRFIIPSSQFNYSLDQNCGFCNSLPLGSYEYPPKSDCLPSGLLDISGCQGAPIIISKPHFYHSDPVVKRFVPRFQPKYEVDETTIDIEPYTGTVLKAHNRLQINTLVNQYRHIRSLSVMRPGAYPLVWLNESFFIDESSLKKLNSQLFSPMSLVHTLCWVAVGVGSFLIAVSIGLVIVSVCCFKDNQKKDS